MNKIDWTKREFEAYVLLYAAHCNHFESKEEKAYILARVDDATFHKIHTEVVIDSEEEGLNKIQKYISEKLCKILRLLFLFLSESRQFHHLQLHLPSRYYQDQGLGIFLLYLK